MLCVLPTLLRDRCGRSPNIVRATPTRRIKRETNPNRWCGDILPRALPALFRQGCSLKAHSVGPTVSFHMTG